MYLRIIRTGSLCRQQCITKQPHFVFGAGLHDCRLGKMIVCRWISNRKKKSTSDECVYFFKYIFKTRIFAKKKKMEGSRIIWQYKKRKLCSAFSWMCMSYKGEAHIKIFRMTFHLTTGETFYGNLKSNLVRKLIKNSYKCNCVTCSMNATLGWRIPKIF